MKRRIAGMFGGFLAVMILFTVLSRAADSVSIAKVTTGKSEQGKITHTVKGSGKVVQNREQAVSALSGQIVKTIYVEEGQQVSAGELLFEVDLESLQEQILDKKQEMKKEELLSGDKASSRAAQAQQDAVNQSRAAEDYSVAAGKGNTAVSRARQEWKKAQQKLKELEESSTEGSGSDPVEEVLKKTCEEKKLEYQEALEYKEELEEAIDQAVESALANAGSASGLAKLTVNETEMVMAANEEPSGSGETDGASSDSTGMDGALAEPAGVAETEPADSGSITGEASDAAGAWNASERGTGYEFGEMQGSETEATEVTEAVNESDSGADGSSQSQSGLDGGFDGSAGDPSNTSGSVSGNGSGGTSGASGWEDEEEQIIEPEDTQPQTEDPWLLEQRVRQINQPLLDEAEQLIKQKEQEKEDADAALSNYRQEKAAGSAQSLEEMKEQLEEEALAKKQAYEDAVTAANDSLRTAGRAIEDASAPKGTDSTGEIDAITREQEELQLAKLERLMEAEGKVTSPIDGVVTRVAVTTGERTPDGTAVLLSDTASGNKLVVQVSSDQDKYIARNDEVTVKQEGKSREWKGLLVDSVRTNEEDKELLDITVQLPEDSLEAGEAASLEAVRASELYSCCIPIEALHVEDGKYFVYVVNETETVLGTELTLQRIDVTVLDKNESKAALAEGSLSGDQKVVLSSDREISSGSRVRLN